MQHPQYFLACGDDIRFGQEMSLVPLLPCHRDGRVEWNHTAHFYVDLVLMFLCIFRVLDFSSHTRDHDGCALSHGCAYMDFINKGIVL